MINCTKYLIDYDAETIGKALEYMQYRAYQLLKYGYSLEQVNIIKKQAVICTYRGLEEEYQSIYILKQHRNKGLFKKLLGSLPILTLLECDIDGYLSKNNIKHRVIPFDAAYELISSYYKNKTASRSRRYYMNHIEEGGYVLHKLEADNDTKAAYYIHPILQSDKDFLQNYKSYLPGISHSPIMLAMEYRRVANSYLSGDDINNFVGLTCEEIREMLIADKVQNYKDLVLYNTDHPKYKQLKQYFDNWLSILEIDYSYVEDLISTMRVLASKFKSS